MQRQSTNTLDANRADSRAFVEMLRLRSGPIATCEIKTFYRRLDGAEIDASLRELTADTNVRIRATAEAREGFAAFMAKRPPAWVKE